MVPVILWVRSSLSNCFTSNVGSLSCFNTPAFFLSSFAGFAFFAIATKIYKTDTEKIQAAATYKPNNGCTRKNVHLWIIGQRNTNQQRI